MKSYQVTSDYDYLFECLVVGDGGSGKSSLITRFADNVFFENSPGKIGTAFKLKKIEVDEDTCLLKLWDGPNQHGNSRGAYAVIICVDMTRQEGVFDCLQRNLQEIDRYALRDVVVTIVGTKIDNDNSYVQENIAALREFYEQIKSPRHILGFVSSKNNMGVNDIFIATTRAIFLSKDLKPSSKVQQSKSMQKSIEKSKYDKILDIWRKKWETLETHSGFSFQNDADVKKILTLLADYACFDGSTMLSGLSRFFTHPRRNYADQIEAVISLYFSTTPKAFEQITVNDLLKKLKEKVGIPKNPQGDMSAIFKVIKDMTKVDYYKLNMTVSLRPV